MTKKSLVTALSLAARLAFAGNAYAQEQKSPEVIATFEYQSNRPEKEYNGKTFQYHILSDGSVVQADKPNVKFSKIWFYDINGNGKLDAEELEAPKSGTLIYMHPKFNEKANAEAKRALENLIDSKEQNPNLQIELAQSKEANKKLTQELKENSQVNLKDTYLPYARETPIILDEPQVKSDTYFPKEKVNSVWSLIAGANVNSDFDKYGLSLGLRTNPFKNEEIGLGLTADFGFGKDKQVDSQRILLSRGKEFIGEINEINNHSLGLSAELQLSNFIIGGGFDYSNYISETNEKLIRGEETLDSSSNSVLEGKIYGKGYMGLEFQPTKKWGIGATIGYHGKDKLQFGIRNKIKLNERK